jgi:hypothetical protein
MELEQAALEIDFELHEWAEVTFGLLLSEAREPRRPDSMRCQARGGGTRWLPSRGGLEPFAMASYGFGARN